MVTTPDPPLVLACSIEAVAARLRTAIAGRPLDRVARDAGIDRQTLRKFLRGVGYKRAMYPDTIARLATVLGRPAGWLMYGEGGDGT